MYGIQFPTDPMMDHFLSSVCVEHLNRCKISIAFHLVFDLNFKLAGGMRLLRKRMPTKLCMTVEAQSDQLCVPAVPKYQFFCQWRAAKPKTAPSNLFDFVYVYRNLDVLWFSIYWPELQSISECSTGRWMDYFRSSLGFYLLPFPTLILQYLLH